MTHTPSSLSDIFARLDAAASDRALRLAAGLADAGVQAGEPVVWQGVQSHDAAATFWAAVALGAVFAPLDADWPEYQLSQVAPRLNPRIVVCDAAKAEACRAAFPSARVATAAELAQAAPAAFTPAAPEAPAAYLFTSGSTGAPKAVVLSGAALAASAATAVGAFGWRPGERLVNLPEPHTMSGLRNAFLAAPLAGMTWLPRPPAERPNLIELLDRLDGCERLVCGPLLIRHLALMADRLEPEALGPLKAIYCTGANLGPDDAKTVHTRFGVPVIDYYGLTETGGVCLSQRLDGWSPEDRTLGRAAGCEARLVEGELQVRGPQLMSAYLGDPAATAARFDGDWLRTGDLMRETPDGRFALVGRVDGFINTAATERVSPEEVEQVLEQHPSVAEAAVCGLTEADGFERVSALIVARGAPAPDLPERLAAFVADRLGPARRPARVRLVERLPRRDNGKLIRPELKGLFDERA